MSIAYTSLVQPDTTIEHFPDDNDDWRDLDIYSQMIHHQHYHCPLYTWLAIGWRDTQSMGTVREYHLYIEFRDISGSSQYQVKTFHSLDQALSFQRKNVHLITLPMISPKQTALRPVGLI